MKIASSSSPISITRVLEERQNFDPAGHYSRPDVLHLTVNRIRQRAAQFHDERRSYCE